MNSDGYYVWVGLPDGDVGDEGEELGLVGVDEGEEGLPDGDVGDE